MLFGLFKSRKEEEDFSAPARGSLKAYISRSEREASYKEARITTPTGYVVRGIVLDHSDTGVRMRFQNIESLPEIVELKISGLNIHTMARLAWQDKIDIGLEYIKPSD